MRVLWPFLCKTFIHVFINVNKEDVRRIKKIIKSGTPPTEENMNSFQKTNDYKNINSEEEIIIADIIKKGFR